MSVRVKTGLVVVALSMLLLPWLARADEVPGGGASVTSEQVAAADNAVSLPVGSATTSWLAMQREGQHSANRLPVLGDEATAAYARYLESFNHKIPAFFSSSVTSGGENAGQSGW
ncbi:DUF3613 domain-containing protein [Crenobacter sp. SG2305]|uniref:DUF3613 domain-containing protein n=1 Tax=Crenobacter oryzisoli TaxID=3056844 RepID=UPI0025AA8CA2|nr:DUF3613 domain-containing protein [Crenobacter sp. SG2305]MDN0085057.1 DUF3613 domain-containing protein [Crenobacter sp. SG2305]